MKTTGIFLLILGLSLTLSSGVKFFTKETVIDIAGVEITRNKPTDINWPSYLGFAVLGAGILAFWKGKKK